MDSIESSVVETAKDVVESIEEKVDEVSEVKDVIEGGWKAYVDNSFTASECRRLDQKSQVRIIQ